MFRGFPDGVYSLLYLSMPAFPTAIPEVLGGFADRLAEVFGEEPAATVLRTMSEPKRVGYWVNPLRSGEPMADSVPVAGLSGCWSVGPEQREAVVAGPGAEHGGVYPINPSSVLAVLALAPQPGEEILDLAAAPGGKTLLMAAAMDNVGRLAAVEPVKGRFHRMRANLTRCGVSNVDYYLRDGRGVGRSVPERFDAVLLDAPCSSEARMRLDDPSSYAHWKPRKIKETSRKQKALLRSAYAALKPGGRLVYCTCSYAPEENEIPLNHLLRREPGAKLEPLELPCPARRPGLTRWRNRELQPTLEHAVRIVPDELWDGFFLCRIVKPSG